MKRKSILGIVIVLAIIFGGAVSSINGFVRPPLGLTGYVKDASTSLPIESASVDLYVYDFITGWIYVGHDETDDTGKYEFSSVPIGAREVHISASGYHSYEGVFQSTIYLEVFTYDYIFYGHIRDARTSQELSNAIVKITCGSKLISYTTDNSGYYCIKFSYGTSGTRTFSLVASRSGYSTKTNTITRNYGYEYQHYYLGLSWALVVAGETEERFTRDAFGMYNTLIDHYGLTDSRIYLITPLDSIDNINVPRDKATSRSNVEWGTNQIENNAIVEDQVIIWWTGHGSVDSFATDSDSISASQLDDYLDDITCDRMFIILGPCHSGSFINDLNAEINRVIYTSCESTQSGYVTDDGKHSLFPWASYRALDPQMNADDADVNDDDSVSLLEMFDYCVYFVDDYILNVLQPLYPGYTFQQDPVRWPSTGTADNFYFMGDRFY